MKRDRRIRALVLASMVLTAVSGIGCDREGKEARKIVASATSSYELLRPKVGELQKSLSEVSQGADQLAAEVTGGDEWRGRLLATDEIVGVLDGKLKWLAGQLAAAEKAGKKDVALKLQNEITATASDIGQVRNRIVALVHDKARLERLGALMQAPYQKLLQTGYLVKGAKDGIESRLLQMLEDAKTKLDKTKVDRGTWIDFDRLFFIDGGTQLDLIKSRSQLDNVFHILAAYPSAKLKIGGYTDKTASTAADDNVARERARAVQQALVEMGVGADRLRAEGYGSRHAACPANDSDECRARNRRVAAQLLAS